MPVRCFGLTGELLGTVGVLDATMRPDPARVTASTCCSPSSPVVRTATAGSTAGTPAPLAPATGAAGEIDGVETDVEQRGSGLRQFLKGVTEAGDHPGQRVRGVRVSSRSPAREASRTATGRPLELR